MPIIAGMATMRPATAALQGPVDAEDPVDSSAACEDAGDASASPYACDSASDATGTPSAMSLNDESANIILITGSGTAATGSGSRRP